MKMKDAEDMITIVCHVTASFKKKKTAINKRRQSGDVHVTRHSPT